MITTSLLPNGDVLVTSMIDDERPVSVVGDFNGWDPHCDPFIDPDADRHEPNGYGQTHSVFDHSLCSDVQRDDPDRSMSNRRSEPVSA